MARLTGTGRLRERPTLDVIVIIFTLVVATVITSSVLGVVVLEVVNPDGDHEQIVELIDTQIGTILGALLGLIAGQATARREYDSLPPIKSPE